MQTCLNPKIIEILKSGAKEKRLYICEQEPVYFAIYYFSEFFTYAIPPFHYLLYDDFKRLCSGDLDEAAWIAFRESAKTSIAKIMVVWAICYKKKQFINYDSYDKANAEAALFDIAVWLQTNPKLINDFGQLFHKSVNKEKESKLKRINNFITENGVKVEAYSTQESTRGRVYQNIRPDLFVLDDVETSKTKESYPITKKIIDHIDEMKAGLSSTGGILYLGNLITEEGVIDYILKAVERNPKGVARNIPVIEKGEITWPAKYVKTDIEAVEANNQISDRNKWKISLESKRRSLGDQVFETEMLNNPTKSGDLVFNREIMNKRMEHARPPLKVISNIKFWGGYNADHYYAIGADTSEGKGLDANSAVLINFSTTPKKVIATFEDNTIKPNVFAHVLSKIGTKFGECLVAPEINNTGFATVAELQNIYDNIYIREVKTRIENQQSKEYGFRMTEGSKYDVIGQLVSAIEKGQLVVYDEGLLKEMYHYKRQDLNALKMQEGMTRHFDKLIACAIAWEMRKHVSYGEKASLGNKKKITYD